MALILPSEKKSLKSEFFNDLFWYKPETGDLIWKPRSVDLFPNERQMKVWNSRQALNKAGTIASASKGYEYIQVVLAKKTFKAHRIIAVMIGIIDCYGSDLVIDHIDGNPKNNKKNNIRAVSHEANSRNRKRSKSLTGKINGVNYHKLTGKWQVHIGRGKGMSKLVGYYSDWFDAVCARKSEEIKLGYTDRHYRM